jgi:hypothetical protein
MSARWSGAALACVLLALCGSGLLAQQPQTAIVPESITVGDVFRAAIRFELPPGVQAGAPDSIALSPDLELAGRREARIDTAGGGQRITIVYPLTAWRPGSYELPPLTLRFVTDGMERTVVVAFPAFSVRSVLPADTAGIEARPAKDVLGASRLWWPILLALLVAAAVAAALYYWWRRRRKPEPVAVAAAAPRVPARTATLEALHALRTSGLLERGQVKLFHERMSEALRHYVATLRPDWSPDLTTAELAHRMAAAGAAPDTVELVRVLAAADLVKFARRRATTDESLRELDAAVRWVEAAEPEPAAAGTEGRRVA